MRRAAFLALLLVLLPGCGFTKAIGLGTGAVGAAGSIAGFIVLSVAVKHSVPDEDEPAIWDTKKEFVASGALIGGGMALALVGAGLYLLSDTIEKKLQKPPAKKPPAEDPAPTRESTPGEYEIK
ncbi:Hypothetical protein A7982_02055 [Minicystis rosea]|nr:Hypothetical protein A7982_02055 [Minicystis rosea]